MMGRHDRCLIRIYRGQMTTAAEALRKLALPQSYRDVIDVSAAGSRGNRIFEARSANEVPLLPAALPALLVVGWLFLVLVTLIR